MSGSDVNNHGRASLNAKSSATLIMLVMAPDASVRFDAISAQWMSPAPRALPTQMFPETDLGPF